MIVPRPFRAARNAPSIALVALAAASLFTGCLPGPDAGGGQPSGPLYRCIGEAQYSGDWDSIVREVERDPARCDTPAVDPAADSIRKQLAAQRGDIRPAADSARVHVHVMDSQCRFLTEYQDTVPTFAGAVPRILLPLAQDDAGNPLPTGEYFVNTEIEYKDGRKDTAYAKIGFIRIPPCSNPSQNPQVPGEDL